MLQRFRFADAVTRLWRASLLRVLIRFRMALSDCCHSRYSSHASPCHSLPLPTLIPPRSIRVLLEWQFCSLLRPVSFPAHGHCFHYRTDRSRQLRQTKCAVSAQFFYSGWSGPRSNSFTYADRCPPHFFQLFVHTEVDIYALCHDQRL